MQEAKLTQVYVVFLCITGQVEARTMRNGLMLHRLLCSAVLSICVYICLLVCVCAVLCNIRH